MRRVVVVHEDEIFRRGVVACLAEDPLFDVVFSGPAGPVPKDADVAVASPRAIDRNHFDCPIVVCANDTRDSAEYAKRNLVAASLPRTMLTAEQLLAAVRAAAAGLSVNRPGEGPPGIQHVQLDPRRREVLRMLALGADTLAISETLCFSVRTIKSLISDIEHELCAASRAQAVAEGIRRGII